MNISADSATESVTRIIQAERLFAIVRGIAPERIVDVTRALLKGGIRLLEVAIDHSDQNGVEAVLSSLQRIKDEFAEKLCFGAGTVLNPKQVRLVADAGGRFVVSPNVNAAVIKATRDAGLYSMPGAMTPTEICAACDAGANAVKLFPAGVLGPAHVKALLDPLKGVPLIAVGGVGQDNLSQFIAAGCVGVGVGGSLVSAADTDGTDYTDVEGRAHALVHAVRAST